MERGGGKRLSPGCQDARLRRERLDFLKHWHEGRRVSPWMLQIFLADSCNLKCPFCKYGEQAVSKREPLPMEFYDLLLAEASELGVKVCFLMGEGEALVHTEHAARILRKIKEHGMTGWFLTNGTLFDEEFIISLVEVAFDVVIFSLDAPTSKIHDAMRGMPGTFNRVLHALERFAYWKEKASSNFPRLKLNTVVTRENHGTFADLIRFAAAHSVEEVSFIALTESTPSCTDFKLTEDDWSDLKRRIPGLVALASALNVRTNLESFLEVSPEHYFKNVSSILGSAQRLEDGYAFCFQPFLRITVNVDGSVSPCPLFGPDHPGNQTLLDSSLDEIWYGSRFDDARRRMLEHDAFDSCDKCCLPLVLENASLRKDLRSDYAPRPKEQQK